MRSIVPSQGCSIKFVQEHHVDTLTVRTAEEATPEMHAMCEQLLQGEVPVL